MVELGTLALALLLMAAAGIVAVRLGLPPALGYLAAGAIGGSLLSDELPTQTVDELAQVGVLALLFFIGLELDLKRLRRALRSTATTIPFDLMLPGLAVAAAARLWGWSFTEALALGMAMPISSTIFGERLTSGPEVHRAARERVLGVLVSEDVAAAGLIALIVVLGGDAGAGWLGPVAAVGQLVFFLLLLTAGALLLVPRILDEMARRHVPEVLVLWAAGLIILAGYLGHLAGSAELGALVAGVAAAEAGSRYVVRNTLSGIRDLAAAVFFLASGLAVDLVAVVGLLPLCILIAALFAAGKFLVHVPASIAAGLTLRSGLHVGSALATLGEFTLILTTVAVVNGVAHPDMRTVAVGTMVILLPLAVLLNRSAPRVERVFWRVPTKVRRPLLWVAHAVRRESRVQDVSPWGASARVLTANVVLLAAWLLLATWLRPTVEPRLAGTPLPAVAIGWGLVVGIALPLVVGTYRAYRRLVWDLVGLREGEREGAGRVRSRIVDTLVAVGFVLVLVLASLRSPQTLPVLAVGTLVAMIVASVAWRQLTRFHHAMETTIGRVLGHDTRSTALLDQVMDRYPWGVKFTAVVVPPGSPVVGRTLIKSRIAPLSGAMVAVLQRGRREIVNPRPEEVLRPGDTLVLLGDSHQVARAEALIVSHGDAVRMSAQSSTAGVHEVPIAEGSTWAGVRLGDTDIREITGTLVIGVWRQEEQHPEPYQGDLRLQAGDRLILLGTPLQIQRASILAAGIPEAASEPA